MDKSVTGAVIRRLRESRGMTQEELAAVLHVSGKAVSKWETGQGLPDVALLEPLAKALDISVIELFSGQDVRNRNRASNVLRSRFYVCPVCGNSITALGEAVISCCGVTLPPLQLEDAGGEHAICIENAEDEYYVTVLHPMTREHSITFLAAVSDHSVQLVRLYPEGPAEAHFSRSCVKWIYAFCSRHGLFCADAKARARTGTNGSTTAPPQPAHSPFQK